MPKTITERVNLYNGTVEIDFYPVAHRYKLISLDGKPQGFWLAGASTVVGRLDKSAALLPWAVNQFEKALYEFMRDGVNFTRDDLKSMIPLAKVRYTERKKEAAGIGDVVHYAAEHNLVDLTKADGWDELSEEDQVRASHAFNAYRSWFDSIPDLKILKSEFFVFSKKHIFGGIADGLIEQDGKKYLIDYKTSKGIYSSQIYQVAAYLKAYEEETGETLAGAKIVNFCKEDVWKNGQLVKKAGEAIVKDIPRGKLVTAYKAFKGLLDVHRIDQVLCKELAAE